MSASIAKEPNSPREPVDESTPTKEKCAEEPGPELDESKESEEPRDPKDPPRRRGIKRRRSASKPIDVPTKVVPVEQADGTTRLIKLGRRTLLRFRDEAHSYTRFVDALMTEVPDGFEDDTMAQTVYRLCLLLSYPGGGQTPRVPKRQWGHGPWFLQREYVEVHYCLAERIRCREVGGGELHVALGWYRLAADHGHKRAQYWTSMYLYMMDPGSDEAAAYLQAAVDHGCTRAQYRLARRLEDQGQPFTGRVARLYAKSAVRGNALALRALLDKAQPYLTVRLERKDRELWLHALVHHAEGGYVEAARILHDVYKTGRWGFRADVAKERTWRKEMARKRRLRPVLPSCEDGDEDAIEMRKARERLFPEEAQCRRIPRKSW